jgi:hypothetical protein
MTSKIATSISRGAFRLPWWLEWLLGLVVLLELIAPFVTTTYGSDGPVQKYWIGAYAQLLREGILLPHWLPAAFRGFGSPTFYYYPPLSFQLAGLISLATGITNTNVLYQSVVILSTALGVLGMWKLLAWLGVTTYRASIGSVMYAFAPYRIAEIYSHSSLSSIMGYAWLPFLCLGLLWISSSHSRAQLHGVILTSISLSLIALSSLPLSMVVAVIGLLVAIVAHRSISPHAFMRMGTAIVLSVAASAFYLFPLAEFREAIHLANATGDPEFAVMDLLRMTGMPGVFHSAIIYTAMVLIGIAYWRIGRSSKNGTSTERLTLRIAWSISILILLLDLPISIPVWRYVPIVSLVQGPWRFYIFVVVLLAILIGISQHPKLHRLIVGTISIWMIGALIPIMLVIFDFHVYTHHITVSLDPSEYLPAGATDSVFASNMPERFLPVLEHLSPLPCSIILPPLSPQEYCTRWSFGAMAETFLVSLQTPRVATFHRFQWPAWHLYVNDRRINSIPDSMGRATAILPAGSYIATWQLERTPLEQGGLWISGITLVGMVAISVGAFFVGRKRKSDNLISIDQSK